MHSRAENFSHFIDDQDEVALIMHILRLKKEINRPKRKIEYRQIGKPRPFIKNDSLKIHRYRRYIKDILYALEEKGNTYACDENETAAIQFQGSIPLISRLDFYIGSYLGGLEKYEIVIKDEQAFITYTLSDTQSIPPMILMEPNQIPKEEFMAFLRPLHMGEWKKDYSTNRHSYMLFDSTFWEVDVFYENGLEVNEFSGINVFPYNFSTFQSYFESHKKKIDRI